MGLHERQSDTSMEKWEVFHLSTLVFCVLGVLGNVSSLVVLVRHLDEIAGSRLLLSLAVADLGVVSSIAFRTLSYVTYGNSQLTRILEWCFMYSHYCSIYLTLLVFLDRYLKTAKSMLLLKIDYPKIVRRSILAVFGIMLVVSLLHLLGACVRYFDGNHFVKITFCSCYRYISLCNLTSSVWEIRTCDDAFSSGRNASYADLGEYQALVDVLCNTELYRHCRSLRSWESRLLRFPAGKFKPTYFVDPECYGPQRKARQLMKNSLRVCTLDTKKKLRDEPAFVKTVYLGIDFPLRYIIPCCFLVFIGTGLVNAVYKARKRHRAMTRKEFKSLLNLPAFWNTSGIVFVFLACQSGGLGLFAYDIFRLLHNVDYEGEINVFMDEGSSSRQLELVSVAFLFPAINSSINIILYTFFLPVFRKKWLSLFIPGLARISSCTLRRKTVDAKDIIPMEEVSGNQH